MLIKITAGSDCLGFPEDCLLLQLKCNLLVGGDDHAFTLIHFETPKIAKMLCNVYKDSCIAKYLLKQLFTVDLPC
jgi:hypothetical protein